MQRQHIAMQHIVVLPVRSELDLNISIVEARETHPLCEANLDAASVRISGSSFEALKGGDTAAGVGARAVGPARISVVVDGGFSQLLAIDSPMQQWRM